MIRGPSVPERAFVCRGPVMSRSTILAVAAVLALGGAADGAKAQSLAAAALREPVSAGAPAGDYRIGPQDQLEINVFQVADLNRLVTVDSGGRILLPLLGQVQAAGLTSQQLSADLASKLEKSYVNNPQVTVLVKDAQGQRITVDGAVTQPGVYALTGPTTLMQAVALAKGPDVRVANLKKVAVFRMEGEGRVAHSYDLKAIREGKAADPVIYGKDVIVIDSSGGRSMLRDLGSAVPILSMLRWGW
jgi:polysaccharide biosynthesis/export protein